MNEPRRTPESPLQRGIRTANLADQKTLSNRNLIEIIDAQAVKVSERTLIALIVIFAIAGGIGAHIGFERQEQAYQNERN